MSSFVSANIKVFNKQKSTIDDLESIINKPVFIDVDRGQDEVKENQIIKQIKLVNKSPEKLLSCSLTINKFYELTYDGKIRNIIPRSIYISWATTGKRTVNNEVDLLNEIPEQAYFK